MLDFGRILTIGGAAMALGLAVFVVGTLADEKTWVATRNPVGMLGPNQRVFGVQIGMDRTLSARTLNERGFTYAEVTHGESCLGQAGRELEVYYDFGWRRGTLCVSIVDQKVAGLNWSFVPFSP